MTEKLAQQRVETALKEEDTLDRICAAQNQKIREVIGNYKFWLAIELRKAHQEMFRLTEERDLLIKENLRMRKTIIAIRENLKEIQ